MGTIRTNYDVYFRDFRDCPVFTSKVFGKNRRRHLIPVTPRKNNPQLAGSPVTPAEKRAEWPAPFPLNHQDNVQ
jgi:hypothetical protein